MKRWNIQKKWFLKLCNYETKFKKHDIPYPCNTCQTNNIQLNIVSIGMVDETGICDTIGLTFGKHIEIDKPWKRGFPFPNQL